MAETTTEESTEALPDGGHKLSRAERRQLRAEIALGDAPYRQLAMKFGISHQWVKQIAVADREEIEAIKAEITEREKLLWPVDRYTRNLHRTTRLAQIAEEMRRHETARETFGEITEAEVPLSEQWLKLLDAEQRILAKIQEDYAQVPLRVPAHRLGLLPTVPTQEMLPSTLAVYPEWNPRTHWCNPFDVPDHWAHWWGVDFGFDHPTSWGNFAESPDGALYLIQEIHATRLPDRELAREIVRLTAGQRMPQAMVCDHDPARQAALVEALCEAHPAFERLRVVSAFKNVQDGIAAVRTRLVTGRFQIFRNALARPDPRLLDRNAPTCTAEEFPLYVWNGDGPVKEDDDGLDKTRYVIAQIDLVGG